MKPTVKSTLYREKIARAMWNSRNVSDWADVTNTGLISIYHNLADAAIAALEPAPDHAEWNAAIEAAVKVSEEMSNTREAEQTAFIDDTAIQEADFGNDIAFAIRQLKKGNTHENT